MEVKGWFISKFLLKDLFAASLLVFLDLRISQNVFEIIDFPEHQGHQDIRICKLAKEVDETLKFVVVNRNLPLFCPLCSQCVKNPFVT